MNALRDLSCKQSFILSILLQTNENQVCGSVIFVYVYIEI